MCWKKLIIGIVIVLVSTVGAVHADLVILKSGEMFRTPRAWKQDGGIYFQRDGRTVRVEDRDVDRLIHEKKTAPAPADDPADAPAAAEAPIGNAPPSAASGPAGDPAVPDGPSVDGDVGFLGLAWGMPPSRIDGLTLVNTDPAYGGVQEYARTKTQQRFGRVRVDRIVYGFWQGELYTIVVEVRNFLDFRDLKADVFRRYGKGRQNRDDVEKYYWLDATADRLLAYDTDTDSGYLWMRSRCVHDRVKARYPE